MPVNTPFEKKSTQFRVQNISKDGRTIRKYLEKIPKNGLIDLMTGRFERAYIKADGPISGDHDYFYTFHRASYVSDGKDYIFLRNQRPVIADQFDYFKNWYYETQEIDYIV